MRLLYKETEYSATAIFEHTGNVCFTISVRPCDAWSLFTLAKCMLGELYEGAQIESFREEGFFTVTM